MPRIRTRVSLACAAALLTALPAQADIVYDQTRCSDPDGAPWELLGADVAISEGDILVGSPGQFVGRSGRALLFNAETGAIRLELTPAGDVASRRFGTEVALADGLAVVADDRADGGPAVYVFDAASGTQVAKLTSADPSSELGFGASVAIGAGLIAVGDTLAEVGGVAQGVVRLFDAATGAEVATITGSTATEDARFGWSVATDGSVLAVGAPGNRDPVPATGAVFLFDLTTFQELRALTMPAPALFDGVGESVAIGEGMVIAGSILSDGFRGAVHAFDADSGDYLFEMLAPAADEPRAGGSVAIAGGRVAAGAGVSACAADSGAVYVFDAATGGYLDTLQPSICFEGGSFGASVDAEGDVLVVGAPTARLPSLPVPQGAAHVFDYGVFGCPANFNGDSFVNFFDLVDFLSAFRAQDPGADMAPPAGVFNFFDVDAFLDVYGAGCP